VSRWCCPSIWTVALQLHAILILRLERPDHREWRPDGWTSAAHYFHIKTCTFGPWRWTSEQLNFVCTTCLIKDSVQTEYHIVRTVAAVFPYLCLRKKSFYLSNTEGRPNGIATSSGRFHRCTWTLDSFGTMKSGRMICHYVWTDATLNSSRLLDTDGGSGRKVLVIWMDVAN
jgi:hypothetical protein